ncbi:hypothetical protein ONE63_008059 [Megalurothrips usitatus]|uniref:Uncharacterized protein n=1 Tax=Megalurothrips usitatus TaxID=439358 RepID=A0AAV7XT56_9NEOP|nr:hypothetical protein ONE63_008059 [Megalurothrips usitatus]
MAQDGNIWFDDSFDWDGLHYIEDDVELENFMLAVDLPESENISYGDTFRSGVAVTSTQEVSDSPLSPAEVVDVDASTLLMSDLNETSLEVSLLNETFKYGLCGKGHRLQGCLYGGDECVGDHGQAFCRCGLESVLDTSTDFGCFITPPLVDLVSSDDEAMSGESEAPAAVPVVPLDDSTISDSGCGSASGSRSASEDDEVVGGRGRNRRRFFSSSSESDDDEEVRGHRGPKRMRLLSSESESSEEEGEEVGDDANDNDHHDDHDGDHDHGDDGHDGDDSSSNGNDGYHDASYGDDAVGDDSGHQDHEDDSGMRGKRCQIQSSSSSGESGDEEEGKIGSETEEGSLSGGESVVSDQNGGEGAVIQEGGAAPQLVQLVGVNTRRVQRFNYDFNELHFEVLPRPADIPALDWIYLVVEQLLEQSWVGVDEEDYIGLEVFAPNGEADGEEFRAFHIAITQKQNIDAGTIMDRIAALSQSNQNLFVTGQIRINFLHQRMPTGGRRPPAWGQADHELFTGRKRSLLSIKTPNGERYCFARCLLEGEAYQEWLRAKEGGDEVIVREACRKKDRLRKGSQRKRCEKIIRDAGLDLRVIIRKGVSVAAPHAPLPGPPPKNGEVSIPHTAVVSAPADRCDPVPDKSNLPTEHLEHPTNDDPQGNILPEEATAFPTDNYQETPDEAMHDGYDFRSQDKDPLPTLCCHTECTADDIMLMTLSLGHRHNLPWVAMVDILKMQNAINGKKKVLTSKLSFMNRLLENNRLEVRNHYFWDECSVYMAAAEPAVSSIVCEYCSTTTNMAKSTTYFASISLESQLKELLADKQVAESILTYRFNRVKDSEENLEDIYDGSEY